MQFWEFMANMQWRDEVDYRRESWFFIQRGYVGALICDLLSGDEICVLKRYKLPIIIGKWEKIIIKKSPGGV